MKRFISVVMCLVLCVSVLASLTSMAYSINFAEDSDHGDKAYDWGDYNWDEIEADMDDDSDSSFLGGGYFTVITIVCVVLALILIVVIALFTKKRKRKQKHHRHHHHHHHGEHKHHEGQKNSEHHEHRHHHHHHEDNEELEGHEHHHHHHYHYHVDNDELENHEHHHHHHRHHRHHEEHAHHHHHEHHGDHKHYHHHEHTVSGVQRDQNLRPICEFIGIDPAFDLLGFKAKLSNLYVQMLGGWQDKNIEALRPCFTDSIFEQLDRRLDALRQNKQTNYVEKIAGVGVEVLGFRQSGGQDAIVVELRTSITDYTLDDTTGKLISGSQTHEKFMAYEWDLVRPTGTLTSEQEAVQPVTCPHCGTALSINETAKCPNCGGIVTVQRHDWVISAIRSIS